MDAPSAQEMVERIRAGADDDESAHTAEDRLHLTVLRAIASGDLTGVEAVEVARIAASTDDIDFARWCA